MNIRHVQVVLGLILLGPPLAVGQLPFRTIKRGTDFGQVYGSALANIGDVDLDGIDDLAVGAPGTKKPGSVLAEGAVEVISGLDGTRIWARFGDNQGDHFGSSVCGGFDASGDGIPDLAVGVPQYDHTVVDDGAVFVLDGVSKKVLRILRGIPSTGALFGFALKTIGDVDEDGEVDFLIGAHGTSFLIGGEGYVQVISGRTLSRIRTHKGTHLFDQLGRSFAGLTDINGDGIDDYAIGIPGLDAGGINRGAVKIFSGRDGAPLGYIRGKIDTAQLGTAMASYTHPDRPHDERLLVAAPFDTHIGPVAGRVDVISMTDFSILKKFYPDSSFDRFGSVLANGGDVNGDGVDDMLIGATADAIGGPLSGSVSIVSGRDLDTLVVLPGIPGASLGVALCSAGDINDDGIDEFVMGSLEAGASTLEGSATVMSYMGIERLPNPPSAVGLTWLSGSDLGNPRETQGGLLATDIPGRRCSLLTSLALSGAVGPIYIDPTTTFFREVFIMPPSGSRLFPLDLHQPFIAGTTITMQVVRWPLLNQVSPGINILFGG